MKKISCLLALVFMTMALKHSFAQSSCDLVITETAPGSAFSSCSSVNLVYTVTNSSTSLAYSGISCTVHLPLGIGFVSLNTASTPGITSSSAMGSTDPVFTIPSLAANATATISVAVLCPCAVDPAKAIITHMDVSTSATGICSSTAAGSLSMNVPSLSVQDNNPAVSNLNIGDYGEINYTIKNVYNGIIPSISVNCVPNLTTQLIEYRLSPTGVPPTGSYTVISGSNISISGSDIQTVLANSYAGLGALDKFDLYIRYRVVNCNNDNVDGSGNPNGQFTFSWGCGASPCQSPIVMNTDINSLPGAPVMVVTTLPTFTNSSYCPGGTPIQLGFIYKNTGIGITGLNAPPAGSAKMTDLKIYITTTHDLGTIDPTSFRINGNTFPLTSLVTPGYTGGFDFYEITFAGLSTSLFGGNAAPFGPNTLRDIDGDTYIDDLKEGDNFTVTFDYTYSTTCPLSFAYENKYPSVGTQTKFQNQCGSMPSSDVHTLPFSFANSFECIYGYSTAPNGPELIAPADVVEGVPFSLTICPNASQTWQPANFDFDCPNGFHQLTLTLPPGYHVDPAVVLSGVTVTIYDPCNQIYSTIAGAVTEVPPAGAAPGYVLINFGRIPPVNCGWGNITRVLQCFSLPMYLECTFNPNTHNFGFDQLSYTFDYICDQNCSCSDLMAQASTGTYHHCSGECSKPFFTDEGTFSVKRTTLGYVNNPASSYDCTSTPVLVSASSPDIDLSSAYPGDRINAKLQGGFASGDGNTYESMFMQLRYDKFPASQAAQPDIFIQDPLNPSTITISGSALANGTYTLSYGYVNDPANPVAELNFELPASVLPLLTDPNAVIFDADIHLIARTDGIANGTYNTFYNYGKNKIERLRSEFGGAKIHSGDPTPEDTTYSCDSWGTHFNMLQPYASIYTDLSGNHTTDCGTFDINFYFLVQGALRGLAQSDFPNEFRPYAGLDDHVEIIIPAGYEYVSSGFQTLINAYDPADPNNFDNTYTAPIIPLNPSVPPAPGAGGTTILTYEGLNNGCWPLLDADFWNAYPSMHGILVKVQPACDAPPMGEVKIHTGFTNYTNGDAAYQVHRVVDTINQDLHIYHVNPVLTVTAPPTVNALTNNIDIDFSFCNSNAHNAPHAWIALSNPAGTLSLNSVIILPGGSPLPTIPYAGGILVNVGAIPASTCINLRLSATVNTGGCVTGNDVVHDAINVQWGNECEAPAIGTEALCQQGSTTFDFNRYPSSLNLSAPNGFPTAVVSPCSGTITYNFVIENPSLGTISNPAFWLNLPAGISIQSAVFTYPYTGGTSVTAPAPANTFGSGGTSPGWNLTSLFPTALAGGLTGTTTNPLNQVGVTLTVETSCTYDLVSYLNFYAGGISSCSEALEALAQHHPEMGSTACCNPCTVDVAVTATLTTICFKQETVLTATGADSYTWDAPSGDDPLPGSTATVTPGVTTTYTVTGTTGACSDTATITIVVMPLPVITASALPATICMGQSSVLTGNGAGASGTYTWDAPTGTDPSAGTTTTVTPGATTTYTVTGTTAGGCTSTGTVTVTVNPAPVIAILPGKKVICSGASFTLSALGGVSYSWSDGTSVVSTSSTATVSPATTTTYTVTGTDANGCTNTATATVTVYPTPVITIPTPGTICSGQNATLTASGAVAYLWSTGAGTPSINVNPSTTTTYTVTGSTDGCNSSSTVTVTVNPLPVVGATATLTKICAGETITLTGSGAVNYSWAPALSTTPGTGSPVTATPAASTTYTVTGTDANGCTNTFALPVTVLPNPVISITGPASTICLGQQATLTAIGGSAGSTYSWSPTPASTTSGGAVANVLPTVSGPTVYTVTVVTPDGCKKTATFTVTAASCGCGGTELVAGSATYQNINYAINTNLIITTNTAFTNASFAIGSGITITVNTGKTLTIDHCHLWACNDMWKGIVVNSGGKVVIKNNSLIEDAEIAVYANNATNALGNTIDVTATTFNKNYIGVKVESFVQTAYACPVSITDIVFTSRHFTPSVTSPYSSSSWPITSTLKTLQSANALDEHAINNTTYPFENILKAPHAGVVPYCGVYLDKAGKTMPATITPSTIPSYTSEVVLGGTAGNLLNVYDNMHYGIFALSSNFTTVNSTYQYMVSYGKGNSMGGTGVYGSAAADTYYCRAIVKPSGGLLTGYAANPVPASANTNKFNYVREAVELNNYYDAVINGADVKSTQGASGVSVWTGDAAFIVNTSKYKNLQINSNLITNIEVGIKFDAPTATTYTAPVTIDNNIVQANYTGATITTQSVTYAIYATAVANTTLGSTTNVSTSANKLVNVYYGIYTSNWQRQRSVSNSNNIILRMLSTTSQQFGISHVSNKGNTISDNEVQGPASMPNNLVWAGIYSSMCSKELVSCNNVHHLGRGIEFFGTHSAVEFRDNTLQTDKMAYVLNTNGQIGAQTGPSSATASDNSWPGTWGGGYYKTYVIASNPSASVLSVRSPATYNPVFTLAHNGVSGGSAAYSGSTVAIITPSPSAFRTCTAGTVAGCAGCEVSLLESVVQRAIVYPVWAVQADIMNRHQAFRALKADPSLMSSSSVLSTFYTATQTTSIDVLSQIQDDLEARNFTGATTKLSGLVPANGIETAYKSVYRIFVKSCIDTTITSTDSTTLITLANGCPAIDGPAVYQARSLMNLIYKRADAYPDNCPEIRSGMIAAEEPKQPGYLVYPNPAKDLVYISVSDPELKEAMVELTDITGKQVFLKNVSFDGNIAQLDMNVKNGIYFISILDRSSRKLFTQKVVIAK